MIPQLYVILSRGLYWREHSKGYTNDIGYAGVYNRVNAEGIVRNKRDPPDYMRALADLKVELIDKKKYYKEGIKRIDGMLQMLEESEE